MTLHKTSRVQRSSIRSPKRRNASNEYWCCSLRLSKGLHNFHYCNSLWVSFPFITQINQFHFYQHLVLDEQWKQFKQESEVLFLSGDFRSMVSLNASLAKKRQRLEIQLYSITRAFSQLRPRTLFTYNYHIDILDTLSK